MDVQIDELYTSVDVIDNASLLNRETLERIVHSVMKALESRRREEQTTRADLDTSSIVEQQRRRQ
jgi:hypothetical protein